MPKPERRRIHIGGIVQGVGMRPFIHRLAIRHDLAGFVQNRTDGVVIEVEGAPSALEAFRRELQTSPPPLVHISSFETAPAEPKGERGFQIIASDATGQIDITITPDAAICEDCLAELRNPADRRFGYPFINCTNCGPRLTIIRDIPYDRSNTSMVCFPLCEACNKEYTDPGNRRFHAEPNACPVCGPHLTLYDAAGSKEPDADPLATARALLISGHILAIKGVGGYHLACDARNSQSVATLRERKLREAKPLAIIAADISTAKTLAYVSPEEEALLNTPSRPIVLLKRRPDAPLPDSIAPGMNTLGIMLPYAPLHYLLLGPDLPVLVMTSANRTDEPICISNREAMARLHGIADYFLTHNRDILVRCDDSIMTYAAGAPRMLRRSRGFAPRPVTLEHEYPPVLALGGQLKSALCLLKGTQAFMSPHVGDLKTPLARDFFHETIGLMQRITGCRPEILACDLHPGYYATRAAASLPHSRLYQVQHHHAHIVSVMAENNLRGDVIGLAMDGTGYGSDGHVWGGEFFIANERAFTRVAHLREFLLPGAEKALHEPWRIAAALLHQTYGAQWQSHAGELNLIPSGTSAVLLDTMLNSGLNAPPASSMGRLFDGVAAILGLRRNVFFEGQAAMEMEACARPGNPELELPIIHEDGLHMLDARPLVQGIVQHLAAGADPAALAYAFHAALIRACAAMVDVLKKQTGLNRIVLSGGCFQNRLFLEGLYTELQTRPGLNVYHHRHVPTNDGGIALGQAVCAAARFQAGE